MSDIISPDELLTKWQALVRNAPDYMLSEIASGFEHYQEWHADATDLPHDIREFERWVQKYDAFAAQVAAARREPKPKPVGGRAFDGVTSTFGEAADAVISPLSKAALAAGVVIGILVWVTRK